MAERVGVRELRQNLSRWLRRVENGESFEVTERGRPVAQLNPLPPENEDVIARLVRHGRIARVGRGSLADLPPPPPAPPGTRPLSEILDELREDKV
ncbi:MAG: type II toxin-antitoxin system prevent-host-death family antitoxin [Gaiellaceae bacterium MAG52_C11]|nr:type II toxin-antitoxin system prevent-host-death family antitoxin [Candidatus Gaiellasilicea maunaloa]